jgi:hypothetical protein
MSGVPIRWLPAGKSGQGAVLWRAEGYDLAISDHPGQIGILRLSSGELITLARSVAWAKELVSLWWGPETLAVYRLPLSGQKSEAS